MHSSKWISGWSVLLKCAYKSTLHEMLDSQLICTGSTDPTYTQHDVMEICHNKCMQASSLCQHTFQQTGNLILRDFLHLGNWFGNWRSLRVVHSKYKGMVWSKYSWLQNSLMLGHEINGIYFAYASLLTKINYKGNLKFVTF